MSDTTTIQVAKTTRDELRDLESYPEEPFDSIIKRLKENYCKKQKPKEAAR